MAPSIQPGDWLVTDPTVVRWPRRGSVVVFREPMSDVLAIKRVAGRPGHVVDTEVGPIRLGAEEAWLLGDASGPSHDSRHYGPVSRDRLVARAWFRYWPPSRVGLVR